MPVIRSAKKISSDEPTHSNNWNPLQRHFMKTFSNTSRMDLDLLRDALRNYSDLIQELQNQDGDKICYLHADKFGNLLPLAPTRIENRIRELIAAIDSEKKILNGGD